MHFDFNEKQPPSGWIATDVIGPASRYVRIIELTKRDLALMSLSILFAMLPILFMSFAASADGMKTAYAFTFTSIEGSPLPLFRAPRG